MGRPPTVDHHSTGVAEPPSCSIIIGDNSSEDVEETVEVKETVEEVMETVEEVMENVRRRWWRR